MNKSLLMAISALILMFESLSPVQAQTPQQLLGQYMSDLKGNPNDNALREKIIKHVLTMRPAPAVPKEAERYMVRGITAMKSAKDLNDFKDAVSEFENATLAAPWLANAYYNLGVAQDKAGSYDTAITNLKLYLLAAPNAPDATNVEKLVYEIEYRQEKAAKMTQQKYAQTDEMAKAQAKQNADDEFIKSLDGAVYTTPATGCTSGERKIEIHGKDLFLSFWEDGGWISTLKLTLDGRKIAPSMGYNRYTGAWFSLASRTDLQFVLSESGDTITEAGKLCGDAVFRRKR